ncbi:hypothetical protein L210DRAFT_3510810 [Boletus edulis BED1]|uniref:Uncharacterized protein n=1 Tax=Boletus edulis BED1 TaxID=1328754 RepID=A0AAD4G6N1_BOLED|nr:hypothetical protein L210DRAFT_3510810 [Boletus edulis BED1]
MTGRLDIDGVGVNTQAPRILDEYLERAEADGGIPGPGVQPRHAPSSSESAIHTDGNEEMVITSTRATSLDNDKAGIRVTDVALGLRQLRNFTITVEQLFDYNAQVVPFSFFPVFIHFGNCKTVEL